MSEPDILILKETAAMPARKDDARPSALSLMHLYQLKIWSISVERQDSGWRGQEQSSSQEPVVGQEEGHAGKSCSSWRSRSAPWSRVMNLARSMSRMRFHGGLALEAAVPPVPEAWPRRRSIKGTLDQDPGPGNRAYCFKEAVANSALVLWHF